MTSEGTVQAPAPNPSNIPWENVLAELEGGGEGEEFKGLDRLASLDFVSDLLSSEGFENFKPPGPEERKLTRLASLELLTELFEWDGALAEGQATPLEEASGVSTDWTDKGFLSALGEGVAQAIDGESTRGSGESSRRDPESGWTPEIFGQDGSPQFPPPSSDHQLELETKTKSTRDAEAQELRIWKRSDAASYAMAPSQTATSRQFSNARQTASSVPRKLGRPMLPSTPPPLEVSDPLAGPRMRFTPEQQKALYDFGESVKWATPGLESEPRAHRMCALIGMGMRQLKKWISNHRPKEHKPPVSHPPWSIPGGWVIDGSHPPLSRAAVASLAAAQAAVMGQPFAGPFDVPPQTQGPFHPQPPGQYSQAPPGMFVPPFGGEMPLPFTSGGVDAIFVDGRYQVNGRLCFGGGSGSSIGSQGSQNEGGLASEASMQGDMGLSSDSVKKVLRKKLKDFEPEKVRKLFDLCMEYRQKRSLLKAGGSFLEALEPPTKRPRTETACPPALVLPPPTPSSGPPGTPNPQTFPSESGDDSELTECERPLTDSNPPSLETVQTLNSGAEKQTPPPGSGTPNQAAWDGAGAFEGRTLSTLPSFPSIDLSHWGDEAGIAPVDADQPARNPGEAPQLASEFSGFVDQNPFPAEGLRNASHMAAAHPYQPCTKLCEHVPNPLRGASGDFRPPSGGERRHSAGRLERIEPPERKVTMELPGYTFLFEKALTVSDTNPLGRIVMPKVQAEAHLPRMAGKEGCTLTVTDAVGKTWELRYSVWLNNKSRMYVLEHAADFLQSRGLAPGDSIAFYRAEDGRLILMDKKHSVSPAAQLGSDGGAAASGFGVSCLSSGHSGAFSAAEISGSQKVEVDPLLLHEFNDDIVR